jgi:redox-sensitive bicupin YhaK (pirin superfamily)
MPRLFATVAVDDFAAGAATPFMPIRVHSGEISATDATTRVLLPTRAQPRWPPFERIAETIATPRRRFPPHRHEGVEVLTHVIEGTGAYELGPGPPAALGPGSTWLLSAPTSIAHAINPGRGQTMRYVTVIATLSATSQGTAGVQTAELGDSIEQPDGTVVHHLVGPGSGLASRVGLECESIEFASDGVAYRRIGHDRLGVCYALTGRGMVSNESLDTGEAALAEDVAGVAIEGRAGLGVVFLTAPRALDPHPS